MTAFEVGVALGFEDAFLPVWIILLGISAIAFIISKYDIMHPYVILMSTMTLSFTFALTKVSAWHLHFSVFAGIILITSLLAFGIGSFWSNWYINDNMPMIKRKILKKDKLAPLKMRNIIFLIAIILMGIFMLLDFYDIHSAAEKLGNTNGYAGMIRTVRLAQEHGMAPPISRWYSYRDIFATSFTYFSLYVFFYNVLYIKDSLLKNIYYISPLVFFVPILILSGGRLGLLSLVIFMITVASFLYQKRHSFNLKSRKITIGVYVFSGLGFMLLFLGFGFFTGKVSLTGRDPFTIIVHYAGLSMPAFSSYLNSTFLEISSIGNSTLWDITKKLNIIGFGLPEPTTFLTFVDFNGTNTNVYTAMRRYIDDYGFVGMYIIMAFLGMLYTAMYNFMRYKYTSNVFIILYAMICLPLYFSINDDMFFAKIIKTSMLYQMVLIYLFSRFCMEKQQ